MKKTIITIAAMFIAVTVTLTACKPDPDFDAIKTEELSFKVPQGWPTPYYQFENNKVSQANFELGRKLFFDTRLSKDNTISCGSCHQPFSAFAQLDHAVSHGVQDKLGTRNSPALFNLNWHTSFFWDGGVNHIESQPINPIQNPVEMDENLGNIITKLNADNTYKQMFASAWGNDSINSQRIFKSLAMFMGMLVSSNSKYDKYKRGETGGNMTAEELSGYEIYKAKCSGCHTEPLFSDFSYKNNGLPPTGVNDSGRAHITRAAADMYKFKVPSLRNLAYTMPFMHDGRFGNLNQVLDHYAGSIHTSPTLDPQLQNGIRLNSQQRSDLLAFLNTLNDESFVKDSRFQQPK